MVSQLKVNEIIKQSGSSISIGESGDTITLPSTATLTNFPSNTPAFMANLGSGQSIANDTTTKVNMDTEIYDTDSKYDTSNYRFTPGVAGKYLVFAQIMYTAYAADGTAAGLLVKKNGSTVQESYERSAYGSNFDFYIHIATSVILDDDDYIEIFTRQGSGGAKTAYQGSLYSFWGASKLIGA
jgi:hypothetical protein